MNGITLHVGPLDRSGKRLVIACRDGVDHQDRFSTDVAFQRQQFTKAVGEKFGVDAAGDHRIDDEILRLAEAEDNRAEAVEQWKAPEPFDAETLPTFPVDALPPSLRDWVAAETEATQTPADLAGLLSLAVCAAAIARKVEVQPREGWREPTNLFVCVQLSPGNRKSAVFSDALRPLREYWERISELAKPSVARAQSERRQDESRLKKLERLAAEKGDTEARQAAGELAIQLAATPEATLPRLIVDDATPEKLAMMLEQQGGRIASMSPEGNVFDLMAGQYSKNGGTSFDVYLKGHAGYDLVTDRVSRESVRVERPALTCAYAIQPSVIKGLAKNPSFRGRGLLARFLYALPQSTIGRRKVAAEPVSDEVKNTYHQTVENLFSIEDGYVLTLTFEAEITFEKWETEIEAMLRDGGAMEHVRDWGAKLAGATLRLAAILHLAENSPGQIGTPSINAAIQIAQYLIPHASRTMDSMLAGASDAGDAQHVLKWIIRHGKRTFSKSESQHHCKRRFPRADDITPAMAELSARGFIRHRESTNVGRGRPASPSYETNPAVFEN